MTRTAAQLIAEWRESQNNPLRVLVRKWRSGVPDAAAVEPYDAGKLICAFELEALLETADTGELASRINYLVETTVEERLRIAAEPVPRPDDGSSAQSHMPERTGSIPVRAPSFAAERVGPGELIAAMREHAQMETAEANRLGNLHDAWGFKRVADAVSHCADELESWWAERAGKASVDSAVGDRSMVGTVPESPSYNECLYCGEPVEAPALYCCEEHAEGRSLE